MRPMTAAKSGRPSSSRRTSSPSSSTRWVHRVSPSAASSGNSLVALRPGRVRSVSDPRSIRSCARLPSHLTSETQRASPRSGSDPVRASIGGRNRGSASRPGIATRVRPSTVRPALRCGLQPVPVPIVLPEGSRASSAATDREVITENRSTPAAGRRLRVCAGGGEFPGGNAERASGTLNLERRAGQQPTGDQPRLGEGPGVLVAVRTGKLPAEAEPGVRAHVDHERAVGMLAARESSSGASQNRSAPAVATICP